MPLVDWKAGSTAASLVELTAAMRAEQKAVQSVEKSGRWKVDLMVVKMVERRVEKMAVKTVEP